MELIKKIKAKNATICVVGMGHIGLPNAILFADNGYDVIGADINPEIIKTLERGKSHITDEELEQGVKRQINNHLTVTTNIEKAVSRSDIVIICVPTPAKGDVPDLSFVKSATSKIGKGLDDKKERLVISESSIMPGTSAGIIKKTLERVSGLVAGKEFFVGHSLERLNPGDKQHTISNTPRVVAGDDPQSRELIETFYNMVINSEIVVLNSTKAVETCKLVENIQRDVNIAYIQEVSRICEVIGVDVAEVIRGCKTKWNWYDVKPSAGVGGHCLPNNSYFLTRLSEDEGFVPKLIPLAREVNDSMPSHVVELITKGMEQAGIPISGANIALFGVSYKKNTDDIRQAPSIEIAHLLKEKGANILVTDPFVSKGVQRRVFQTTPETPTKLLDSDVVVLITFHDQFKEVDFSKGKSKLVVDTTLTLDRDKIESAGKKLVSLGRPIN